MDLSRILSQVESDSEDETVRLLQQYNQENNCTFTFDQKEEEKRVKLCRSLLKVLGRPVSPLCLSTCLGTLRILSRDKRVLGPVATREGMAALARLAGLLPGEGAELTGAEPAEAGSVEVETGGAEPAGAELMGADPAEPKAQLEEERVAVEALKCLCNVVFNSPTAQQVSQDICLARGLCARLGASRAPGHEVCLFSLRLVFLLSALRTDARNSLRGELRALPLLTEVLQRTLDVRWAGPYQAATPEPQAPPLLPQAFERAVEALKALFNLTLSETSEEDGAHQLRLISALMRHLLLLKAQTDDKTEEAHSHAINLLSNMPGCCLDVLIDVPPRGGPEWGGKNMEAVQVLLDFMEKRIDKGTNYKEGLTPVLSLLTESCRHHREIRRYIKTQVLPPLKDVKNRPEVGSTVRNKLVRLMTHVDMGVKQSAAEFLFVLCKESVDSLLKYTGYGNAAGLLVARGLLAGGRGEGQYSEDEDSDTEEYKEAKPFINPITGHVEEPMPNPMEEMSEEQKEYEAQKLVNMFDKLSRHQLITPMGVKRDGTLAPLEKTIHQCNVESSSSDSD
ncbi:synembryn-B [Megalops cyprinoides]|uniref:synembryn-B n=1 Tax=Megalops cyprinoides TaxID=118141 RepID=UPI001863A9AE|nr:synembryn-B [Megalops cyprinoides]